MAPVRVQIYDQSYTLGGNDAAALRRLAEAVDAKMRQVARETRIVDSVRVAVLAAVNLADENETLRARVRELEQGVQARAGALHRSLDKLLSR